MKKEEFLVFLGLSRGEGKKKKKIKKKIKNMTKKIVKKELQVPENADRKTKVKGV